MLIYNKNQIKKFIINIYPSLDRDEVLFISLSGRSKYLTEEQKQEGLKINSKEMFHRDFFYGKSFELYEKVINYLESIRFEEDVLTGEDVLEEFYASNGKNLPWNVLSCYVNINPSSMRSAVLSFTSEAIKKINESDHTWFLHAKTKLVNEIQKSKSRRVFVDIDFDVDSIEPVKYFLKKVNGTLIKTHSGYHVLVKKNDLENINLGQTVKETSTLYDNKEIIINSNAMIPLPGTYQGGFPVEILLE